MQAMQGPATLTFDDGTTADVDVNLTFQQRGELMGGRGVVRHEDIFLLSMKDGQPTLECRGRRIKIMITCANSDGTATIITSGGLLG